MIVASNIALAITIAAHTKAAKNLCTQECGYCAVRAVAADLVISQMQCVAYIIENATFRVNNL